MENINLVVEEDGERAELTIFLKGGGLKRANWRSKVDATWKRDRSRMLDLEDVLHDGVLCTRNIIPLVKV